jgi:hypothetical protein
MVGLVRRIVGLARPIAEPGIRRDNPKLAVPERLARSEFVHVAGHVRDPARVAAHGGRERHTARHPAGRSEQAGPSPARPAAGAHGRPARRIWRELRELTVKGESVTPVMLAVERAIAGAIRQ